MSGGAYNYAYQAIDLARRELEERRPGHPLQEPMRLLSEALHDLEWEDSGDTGDGDSDEAVLAFLSCWRPGPSLRDVCTCGHTLLHHGGACQKDECYCQQFEKAA